MKFKFLWSIVLLSLMVFSCNEDDTNDPTDPVDPNPPVISINVDRGADVTTNLTGTVVDEDGNSLEGVTVKVGNKTMQTNEYGVFLLTDAPMKSKRTVVTFMKDGFFNSIKIASAKENETTYVASKLLKKIKAGEFTNNEGGTVEGSEGSSYSIQFDADAVENYTGKVTVFANYIDPTAEDFMLRNSGNMEAVNSNSENGALISYGMLHVELQDENGNILQLNKEKGATVSMTVPTKLRTNAPAEMPLWSFNETEGVWVEEGKGTLSNNIYTGKVTHFSLWNYDKFIERDDYKCDVPFDINIENVEDESTYITVEIKTTSGNIYKGDTYSDKEGKFATCLPTNISSYTIKVYSKNFNNQECSLLKEFTGNTLSHTSANTLNLTSSNIAEKSITKFSGTLVNCNNENVTRGLIIVKLPQNKGTISQEVIKDGKFSFDTIICLKKDDVKQAEVTVYDLSKGTASFEKTIDLSNSKDITLSACETTTKIWPGDFDYRRSAQDFFDGEYTEVEGSVIINPTEVIVPTRTSFQDVNLLKNLVKVGKSLTIYDNKGLIADYSGLENLKTVGSNISISGSVKNLLFKKLKNVNSISLREHSLLSNITFPELETVSSIFVSGRIYQTNAVIKDIQFPKLTNVDIFEYTSEEYSNFDYVMIKDNSFQFPLLKTIKQLIFRHSNEMLSTGRAVSFAYFSNVTSIESFEVHGVGNTNLNGLEKAKIDSISITKNTKLVDLCAISQATINALTADKYSVSENGYNPTLQDLKDGKCKK